MSVLWIPPGLALPDRWAVGAAWFLLAAVAPAWAADGLTTAPAVPRVAGAAAPVSQETSPRPIGDVALRRGGVLEGRVVCAAERARCVGVAGRPVMLVRG